MEPPAPIFGVPDDAELLVDEDMVEVLERLRKRETFWVYSDDDDDAVATLRSTYPRPTLTAEPDPYEDGFDEGVSSVVPLHAKEEGTMPNPEDPRELLSVVGRSKWQVKYVMAKAKLMLVEEENLLRRRELKSLLGVEQAGA